MRVMQDDKRQLTLHLGVGPWGLMGCRGTRANVPQLERAVANPLPPVTTCKCGTSVDRYLDLSKETQNLALRKQFTFRKMTNEYRKPWRFLLPLIYMATVGGPG